MYLQHLTWIFSTCENFWKREKNNYIMWWARLKLSLRKSTTIYRDPNILTAFICLLRLQLCLLQLHQCQNHPPRLAGAPGNELSPLLTLLLNHLPRRLLQEMERREKRKVDQVGREREEKELGAKLYSFYQHHTNMIILLDKLHWKRKSLHLRESLKRICMYFCFIYQQYSSNSVSRQSTGDTVHLTPYDFLFMLIL